MAALPVPGTHVRRAACLLALATWLTACAHRAPPAANAPTVAIDSFALAAPDVAATPMRVRVWLPPGYDAKASRRYPTLYINDGQDMEAVGLPATLACLYTNGTIRPFIAVAIDMPPDRMGAYGFSDRGAGRSLVAPTRYGPVGTKAHAYSEWVVHALVPEIDRRYRTRAKTDDRAMLGWSLGAANAFNLGWQYPEAFGRVGAFSPSFWLSTKRGDVQQVQETRLAQGMVAGGTSRHSARYFFAVGTAEETDDRDGDGVFDALDDARDLLLGWKMGDKVRMKGLQQLGYSVDPDYGARPHRSDAVLFTLDGGQHNQASWARMLPTFLAWAYARDASVMATADQASCR